MGRSRGKRATAQSPLAFVPIALAVLTPVTALSGFALVHLVVLAWLGAIVTYRVPAYARAYFASGFLGVFAALLVASLLWSENRVETAFSLVNWLTEGFAALATAAIAGPRLKRYLANLLKVVLIASVVVAVALPEVGRTDVAGAPWQGIFVHKNALGAVAAFAAVIFAATGRPSRRMLWIGITLVILVQSQSKGGLSAAIVGLFVQGAAYLSYTRRARGQRVPPAIVFYGILAVAGYALVKFSDALLALLHRDADLTGRTEFWAAILDYAEGHALLGTGIGAQIYPDSVLQQEIEYISGAAIGTSHNGYLTVYLGVGVLGVVVFALALAQILYTIDNARRTLRPDVVILALGLLACYVVQNVSLDVALTRSGWFFVAFGVVQILREPRDTRRSR